MFASGTLHDAFVEELRDLYDAEKQLTKALSQMASVAKEPALHEAFMNHLEETHGHVIRLEEVFTSLDEKAERKHCEGIAGIIEEGKTAMDDDFDDATVDAYLIASGQRAEHYEIAAYGTLIAWARAMGHADIADVLEESLDEEVRAEEKLSLLADSGINREAAVAAHPVGTEPAVDRDVSQRTTEPTTAPQRVQQRRQLEERRGMQERRQIQVHGL